MVINRLTGTKSNGRCTGKSTGQALGLLAEALQTPNELIPPNSHTLGEYITSKERMVLLRKACTLAEKLDIKFIMIIKDCLYYNLLQRDEVDV